MHTKKAFTLVELIVVITILAILGTIAFLSLQGYSTNARNSTRSSDLNTIKIGLETYTLKVGGYPDPTGGISITYSGATAWIQGTIGDTVIKNLSNINKKPVDPLVLNEYTYSLLNTKGEYQIGSIEEIGFGDNYVIPAKAGIYEKSIIPSTYAAQNSALAMVLGNYNGQILKVSTGSIDYILAVPSIINSDLSDKDLLSIINKKQLTYDGYSNLPGSYNGKGYTMTGGFNYQPLNIVLLTGSTSTFVANLANSGTLQTQLIDNIKSAYLGSQITIDGNMSQILSTTNTTDKQNLVASMYRYRVAGLYGTVVISNSQQSLGGGGGGGGGSGCDSPDITFGSYTISACNVGTSTAGTGSSSYGYYFQFGRNKGFSEADSSQQSSTIAGFIGLDALTDTYGFAWNGSWVGISNWANTDTTNNWGGAGTNTTGTYYTVGGANQTLMQGPCASGYHIPTSKEWSLLVTAGGWGSNGSAMQTALKLPFAGYRYSWMQLISGKGSSGRYWASSPATPATPQVSYFIDLATSTISVNAFTNGLAQGFNIRCFKN